MLGFKTNLGQIWTNPNVGLKMPFKILNQVQLSLSTVIFVITYLTQIWVETTQLFLECNMQVHSQTRQYLISFVWKDPHGVCIWVIYRDLKNLSK